MKKAIFFDLYGTIIDIRTDEQDILVYKNLSRYLTYHSIAIPPEEFKRIYFNGVQNHLRQNKELYPEVDVCKIFFEIIHKYSKRKYSKRIVIDIAMLFRSLTIRHFRVFTDLYDVLLSLNKRYKIAIISDAQWIFAEPEIAMLGLDQFFRVRILSSRLGYKKPDVKLFVHAIEKLGVSPEDSVYVGDNPMKDLIGAKKAGMKCILFRSECREYDGFHPDACFADYSELENILNKVMD